MSRLWRGRRDPLTPSYLDGALHSSAIPDAAGSLCFLLPARLLVDIHVGARPPTASRRNRPPRSSQCCLETGLSDFDKSGKRCRSRRGRCGLDWPDSWPNRYRGMQKLEPRCRSSLSRIGVAAQRNGSCLDDNQYTVTLPLAMASIFSAIERRSSLSIEALAAIELPHRVVSFSASAADLNDQELALYKLCA